MKKTGSIRKRVVVAALVVGLLCTACAGEDTGRETETTAVTTERTTVITEAATAPTEDLRSQMGFYVDGTTLYDANGNPFIMRGVNHAHTWFPDETEVAVKALAEAGCNCVRIVLSNGEVWERNEAEEVSRVIESCKENDLIAVLEVHDPTGQRDAASAMAAVEYFVSIREALVGEEAYVIINICNEWPSSADFTTWKNTYLEAIPYLREAGLAHTIMVDCGGGGQNGRFMKWGGEEILAADPLKNVMFSIHMYAKSGGSAALVAKNIRYGTDLGLCVCVGEFGYQHDGKDVDEAFIMAYCVENAIGYLAWSWKGNSEQAACLDLALDWEGNELSADWGEIVVNGPNGIRETAIICSVFTDNS